MKSKIITSIMLMSMTIPSFASVSGVITKEVGERIGKAFIRSADSKNALKKSFQTVNKKETSTCKVANCGVGKSGKMKDLTLSGNAATINQQIKGKFPTKFQLNKEIKQVAKDNNYGWYKSARGTGEVIVSGEEEAFLTSMKLGLKGTPAQKDLWQGYVDVATKANGKVDMFSAGGSRFWRLMISELTEAEMQGWTALLKQVALDPDSQVRKFSDFDETNFIKYLKAQAMKAPTKKEQKELLETVDSVQLAQCFFRKQNV